MAGVSDTTGERVVPSGAVSRYLHQKQFRFDLVKIKTEPWGNKIRAYTLFCSVQTALLNKGVGDKAQLQRMGNKNRFKVEDRESEPGRPAGR